jgi:hypothetical protein
VGIGGGAVVFRNGESSITGETLLLSSLLKWEPGGVFSLPLAFSLGRLM